MNAWRVPYEAQMSVVGYASEGSALRSMWRSHGLQPVGLHKNEDDGFRCALFELDVRSTPESIRSHSLVMRVDR